MNSPYRKKISIVVPVFNEELNVPTLYQRLKKVLSALSYDTETLFVNDASTDGSQAVLEGIAAHDPAVKVIEFTRNFGKEIATTAGINQCTGDACIIIDADLQHPVELIPEFITRWEHGAEVVVGIRRSNRGEGFIKRIGSRLFYRILNSIAHTKLTAYATDFRLLDREVIDSFNRFTEQNRITRGLIDWLGYRRDYVHFTANERMQGIASYNFIKLLSLAMNSFVSLSLFPLRLAGYLGIIITLFAGIMGLAIFFTKYVWITGWGSSISGSAILAVIIVFLVGIVLMSLGLIALYIANIHSEILNRPMYVLRKKKA